jgi:hypothetical protein
MLRPILLFGFSGVLLAPAASPPWNVPGACLTPQGTLCRTIRWEYTGWENRSWGFHAIERQNGSNTLAYRRDGAALERHTSRSFKNYVIPLASWDISKIKLPAQHETIEIDHTARSYDTHPGVRGGYPVWDPNDPDCIQNAKAFGLSDLKRADEVVIAGVRSIEYTGVRSSTSRTTVALAPSLGCTQMRYTYRDYNRFGLPTASTQFDVVSVQVGDPDPALFQVPKDYHEKR